MKIKIEILLECSGPTGFAGRSCHNGESHSLLSAVFVFLPYWSRVTESVGFIFLWASLLKTLVTYLRGRVKGLVFAIARMWQMAWLT